MTAENIREYFALAGSIIAMASTAWFWWVRSNRERTWVTFHLGPPMRGTVIRNEDFETLRSVNPGQGEVCAKYWLDVIVANRSIMPNALLELKVQLMDCDGTFREAHVSPLNPETTLAPLNLPPLGTTLMRLNLAIAVEGDIRGGYNEMETQAADGLPPEPRIRFEAAMLDGHPIKIELADSGKALRRSRQGGVHHVDSSDSKMAA